MVENMCIGYRLPSKSYADFSSNGREYVYWSPATQQSYAVNQDPETWPLNFHFKGKNLNT